MNTQLHSACPYGAKDISVAGMAMFGMFADWERDISIIAR